MKILSTLDAATIILIGANLILDVKPELSSQPEVTPQPADSNSPLPKQPSETRVSWIDRYPSEVDPMLLESLKDSVFAVLSPELFSQTYPFDYILSKTENLSTPDLRRVKYNLTKLLNKGKFPKKYVPYAKVLYSLSECLLRLVSWAKKDILRVQRTSGPNYPTLSPHICAADGVELCELFSSEIFAATNPKSRFLYKVLDIPSSEVVNVGVQLKNLVKNHGIPEVYLNYGTRVAQFLLGHSRFELAELRRNISNVQRVIIFDSNTTPDVDVPDMNKIYF